MFLLTIRFTAIRFLFVFLISSQNSAPRLQGSVRSPSLFVRRLKEVRDLVESLLVVKPKDRPRAREVMATNNWLIANGRPVEADEVVQMG